MRCSTFFSLACLALLLSRSAVAGNSGGDLSKQQPKWHLDHVPPAPVLTPQQEKETFNLPHGFHIELVAAEPMVEEPICLTFDPDGRMYIVELRAYMPDIAGTDELAPIGRVVRLSSSKPDGNYDQRTVFLDKLSIPRAVALARDGVLVSEPPNVYFCKVNPDGTAGERKTIITEFASHAADPEHMANGLVPCLDNWYYSANWPYRVRFAPNGNLLREPTISRGQWGISQDDVGRLFYNTNSDMLQCDLFPARYLTRSPYLRSPAGVNVGIASNKTYPGRVTPGINRGYTDDDDMHGKLQRVTAACAPTVYRGEQFPADYRGNVFVCEPSGNMIVRQVLTQNGINISSKSVQHDGVDFLTSQDERFRPVSLSSGPDGALYVVDMYHGILQHKAYLSAYLADQIKQRDLEDKGLHHGRIWRIVADNATPVAQPHLSDATIPVLVKTLSHPNGWWRDTAQRLLVERHDASATPLLEKLIAAPDTAPLAAVHALWTLEGLDQLTDDTALIAVRSPDARMRLAALQAADLLLHKHLANKTQALMSQMGNDPDPQVQLQLVVTGSADLPDIEQVAMTSLSRHLSDPIFRTAAASAAAGREVELLQKLITDGNFAAASEGKQQLQRDLSTCVVRSRSADGIGQLFDLIGKQTSDRVSQQALLDGIADAVAPDAKGHSPVRQLRLPSEPSALPALLTSPDGHIKELAGRIEPALSWPNKPGDKTPPVPELTPEQHNRYVAGHNLFGSICAQCHQPSGLGMEGLAPPLVDSEWVLGSPQRLVRIVLNGLHGPVVVGRKTVDLEMPGLGALDDGQIASVLTYLRREWGHEASPIEPQTVSEIRQQTTARGEMLWTMPELQGIK